MSTLRQSPIFEVTAENAHEIQGLFPEQFKDFVAPIDVLTNEAFNVVIRAEMVRTILDAKDPTTGSGLTGMFYADLQVICKDKVVLDHLTVLVNDIVNGRIPDGCSAKTMLLLGRGVALRKPNGKPRPIGVGEVLLNLSLGALTRQEEGKIKGCLSPDDFGFRTKDGAAKAAHKAQAILTRAAACNQHRVGIKVDIKNAYGTTSRMDVLELLLAKLPSLARAFVFTHGRPHDVHFNGMEPVSQKEGLTQGDPAAPAYSQLLYGSLCQMVRDKVTPEFLGSFFDDIFIFDDFDTAVQSFKELRPLFEAAGMEISLNKTVLYSNRHLTEAQLETLLIEEIGLSLTYEGIMIVGTPVGTDAFVAQVLESKVVEATRVLDDIALAVTAGNLNTPWLNPQGLYHLTRSCANQLLRHLLRTVNPSATSAVFRQIDDTTMDLICHIFSITPDLLTQVVRARITLPGRLTGLGMRTYADEAPCAYIGCLARVMPDIPD
jgi:hypothetical protein